jgi:hypothetical protein
MNFECIVLDLVHILLCVCHFISWREFQYLLNWRLGWPQSQSGLFKSREKCYAPTGIQTLNCSGFSQVCILTVLFQLLNLV